MMQRFYKKRLHQEDDPGPDTALDETPPPPVQMGVGSSGCALRTSAEIGGCQRALPPLVTFGGVMPYSGAGRYCLSVAGTVVFL